jgi:catechol-2,3-dioxygenase
MIPIERLNHAVLFVEKLDRSLQFYRDVLGFSLVVRYSNPPAAFLRASRSNNHHDLGLFQVDEKAENPTRGELGLYHLAWQVSSISDLLAARQVLIGASAFSGESDHGATKSLYGKDPDGNEFELMWMLPRSEWGDFEHQAPVMPLDLEGDVARLSEQPQQTPAH